MGDSFDVVISGIGGRFPECNNVETLMEKLHLGENLITLDNRRWTPGDRGVCANVGKVSEIEYFDNQLFGMHRTLASVTDPLIRLLLERVAEAIFDAGYSLGDLYGSRTSVYTSCSISENESTFIFYKRAAATGIIGLNRSMMANRISYFFNLNGRSCAYDGTWAWASLGLQMAYTAIKSGECDSVIVGGTNLCLYPEISATYSMMKMLSPDGACRPFDADANGCARAESQVIFLIQRSDQAKRAYAKVLGAKMMYDGIMERQLLSPTARTVASVVDSVYQDNNIDKRRVKYVECHGSGYQPIDYAEVEGLKSALGGNRGKPLLIGSVKGNAGNSEGPSGMISVIKAISVLRSGVIPKTLNHNKPNPLIPSLVDGSVEVVKENTPIEVDDDTVIGSTSVSFGGTVGHVALGVASKNKVAVDPEKELPRLILACGRSEGELKRILTKISNVPFDPEYYRLVQDIFSKPIKSFLCRGHVVCPSNNPEAPLNVVLTRGGKRPVWFIFSGMGSQWPGMGKDLLRIPAFAAAIDRCHAVLEKKGLNLRHIITHPEPDIFDNILHSFVGIAAVQIGLINIMRLLGINPDGFIGHSVGEQACAYMDECIDEEQMMLAAHARGMASNEAKLIRGMMAAIGIGYKNIKDKVPASIDVACHNSSDSCTISGPADDVKEFVKELQDQKVFARTVNVSNTAYHSRYVQNAGPILMRRLKEVITAPKRRSNRWISTSAPREIWNTDAARYCSPTYLTNNLLGAVLFEEALEYLPKDVILIEIAPHGLLQAILRRSAPSGTTNISLTQRGAADGVDFLYNAIAKMYAEGLCPQVSKLYPDIEFPVSRQTPSTADLVTFVHDEAFYTVVDSVIRKEEYLNQITIEEGTPSDKIRGKAVCSPSYYLISLWEQLSMHHKYDKNEMAVEFEDVRYFEPQNIQSEGGLILSLQIQHAKSVFEISDNDDVLVLMGKFTVVQEEDREKKEIKYLDESVPTDAVTLSADQLYSELAMRGHNYEASLMALTSVQISDNIWRAKINHKGDMNAVLASAFQLIQLHTDQSTQICSYPKSIRKLSFDPLKFLQAYPKEAEIFLDTKQGLVSCAGLLVTGLAFRPIQTETTKDLQMQASSLSFIPYGTKALQSVEDVASFALQLAEDIQPTAELEVTILELHNGHGYIHKTVGEVLRKTSDRNNVEVNSITMSIAKDTKLSTVPPGAKSCAIILTGPSTLSAATSLLDHCPSALILAHLGADEKESFEKVRHLKLLAEYVSDTGRIVLLRPSVPPHSQTEVIMIPQDKPVPASLNVSTSALLVWTSMPSIGVRAEVDAITKLPKGGLVRMVYILDKNAPKFSIDHPLYRDQLALGMRVNILLDGVWGSLKTLPLPFEAHIVPNGRDSLLAAVSTKTVDGVNISHWGMEHLSATKMSPELGLDFCGEGPNGPVFGVARAVDGQPKLDPLLQWPVPPGWTAADASTVPLAYCQAYLALGLSIYRAMTFWKDNVLITHPLRPEGQAAVRIALATERVANVFTIAQDELEKAAIEALFSDSPDAGKHTCIETDQFSLGSALCRKKLFGVVLDIIVTSSPDDVRTEVLGALRKNGHLVCLGGAETAVNRSFGSVSFTECVSLFFLTNQNVLQMREDDRHRIHAAIAEGLKPSGWVKPLRRVVRSSLSTEHALWNDTDATKNKVVLKVEQSENPTYTFKPGKSCLIAGGTPQQQVNLAHWSAKRGIKTIVVIHAETQSQLFSRHTNLLNSVYGAKLQVFAQLRTGLTEALRFGSLALMLAVAQDPGSERLALELTKTRTTMPLVVFGPKGSDHGALAESCLARHSKVSHSLLLVGRMDQAVNSRLMDWLLRKENPPAVTLLRCPADSRAQRIPAARLLKLLPQGTESLAALGRSFMAKSPHLVELTTNGPKYSKAREVFPLFAVPGLAASDTILKPLADKLIVPLMCVRLPAEVDSVAEEAKEIARIIEDRQPDGPYAILGFDWTATLTQLIAQELQKNGSKVVLFLLDGESSDVSEIAQLSQRQDFESLILSTCLNLHVNTTSFAEISALPTWSDRIRRLAPTFGEGSQEIVSALNAIRRWVVALASHKVCQCQADTHLIKTSAPADFAFVKTSSLSEMRCTETQAVLLTTPKLQHYINDHMGYPTLQTNEALIKQAK